MAEFELPAKDDPTVFPIRSYLDFQWLHEGKAFCITLRQATVEAVDLYADLNIYLLNQWEKDQRFYSIQDVSDEHITITPHFRHQLDAIATEVHKVGVNGHSMVVLQDGVMGRVVQVFGTIFARKVSPVRQHWFRDRNKALASLTQLINADLQE